jgi:hypothetical protein
MNLYLVATHADLAGGLGFLSQGQRAFSPIVFAGGAVIAAQVANAIVYQGATLSSMKSPMLAYGVVALILFVAPLLVVTPVLVALKRKALFEYGALVTIHNQQFDQAWIRKDHPPDPAILGDPGPSSLIDLGDSFAVIRGMNIVPLDKHTVIALALAAMSPMLAVVLFATPASELLRVVLKMLS